MTTTSDTRITSLSSHLSYQTVVSPFELYGKSLNFLLESLLVCLEIQRILIILFIEIIVSRIPFIARNIIIFITPFLNTATKTLLKLPKLQTTVTSNLATFYRSN